MARIILGSYMIRYPLGGVLSSSLQWLAGFQQLGHDVYLVEKSGWAGSCYDPVKNVMSDDCTYGVQAVKELLSRFGLEAKWCYVDATGNYHGMSRQRVEETFRSADLFIDRGTHGAWMEEASATRLRVFVDGEPAFRQMMMENDLKRGISFPHYDYYFTTGRNIGTNLSLAPTAGKRWLSIFHPVAVGLFVVQPCNRDAAFTTVMNWQSHPPVVFNGVTYGHKDVEFHRFMSLPLRTRIPLEVAVAGKKTPYQRLTECGWRVRDAHAVTISFESYLRYAGDSRGEFSICKQGYARTNCGWFSDRSAAYLACGRPVVMQETGFSDHLPCGEGLFAFHTADEALAALEEVNGNYDRHSRKAGELALEYLDASKVLGGMLAQIGLK